MKFSKRNEAVNPTGSSPADRFRNPFNAGIDKLYTEGDDRKTLISPTETTVTGAGIELHDVYNEYWEKGR